MDIWICGHGYFVTYSLHISKHLSGGLGLKWGASPPLCRILCRIFTSWLSAMVAKSHEWHMRQLLCQNTVSEHCVRTLHVRKSLCQNTVCQNTVSEHCKKVTETELKPLQRHFKSYVRVLILEKNVFNSQLFI